MMAITTNSSINVKPVRRVILDISVFSLRQDQRPTVFGAIPNRLAAQLILTEPELLTSHKLLQFYRAKFTIEGFS